jgi:hypothetical protein
MRIFLCMYNSGVKYSKLMVWLLNDSKQVLHLDQGHRVIKLLFLLTYTIRILTISMGFLLETESTPRTSLKFHFIPVFQQ